MYVYVYTQVQPGNLCLNLQFYSTCSLQIDHTIKKKKKKKNYRSFILFNIKLRMLQQTIPANLNQEQSNSSLVPLVVVPLPQNRMFRCGCMRMNAVMNLSFTAFFCSILFFFFFFFLKNDDVLDISFRGSV